MTPRLQKIHQPLGVSFNDALSAIANQHKPTTLSVSAKPFVKWVGGKRSIINILLAKVPKEYSRYVEPFLGGGALFFALQPDDAYLADINFRLIIAYQAIRDDVDGVIKLLKVHEANHSKEYYYDARDKLSTATKPVEIAAWFIYLNKTCFNGLYRVNKDGKFNVPIGSYKEPTIVDETNLRNVSAVLQNAEASIQQGTFTQVKIKRGDFFYIDPPYHQTYDKYTGDGFGDKEHELLADYCRAIDGRDGYFMLSNSDNEFVRKLYKGYNIEQVMASRSVSCKAHQRGRENELIIRNYK